MVPEPYVSCGDSVAMPFTIKCTYFISVDPTLVPNDVFTDNFGVLPGVF